MRDYFFGDERMFESEEEDDELFDLENVYQVPIEMVIHLRNKSEPIFTEHVFFFDKEDPIDSLKELMTFTSTWWGAVTDDKNLKFLYLTDRMSNKKAILAEEIIAVSFVTPEKPEWMVNGEIDTDSD